MPDKNEKKRRKEILHGMREQSRAVVREGLPISVSDLKELFDFLDESLSGSECDGTLVLTRDFATRHQLPDDAIIAWVERNGGHCDCEVLANVEPMVEDAVPGFSSLGEESTTVQ